MAPQRGGGRILSFSVISLHMEHTDYLQDFSVVAAYKKPVVMDWSTTQFSRGNPCYVRLHYPLHVLNLHTIMGLFTGMIHQGPHPLYPYLTGAPTHLSPLKGAPPTFALN